MPTVDDIARASTRDAFLGGAVIVDQPRHGYRAGLDAVLLAASVPAHGKGRPIRLLDVGAGVGVVGLCVAARLPEADVTLVEQSPELCALAAGNITANQLADRARVTEQNILDGTATSDATVPDNAYDVTVSNPPFYDVAAHRQSPHALKAASHAMPDQGLDQWLRFMARKTRPGGTAIVIHRADKLGVLLAGFAPRFGAICVLTLHPRVGVPASRIIVRGIRGSRGPLTIASGIALHGPDDRFTPELERVLKTPVALPCAIET